MADAYNQGYSARAGQLSDYIQNKLPEFDTRYGRLHDAWNVLQQSVDAAHGATHAAQATGLAYNALLSAMKQSGSTLHDDVGGVVTAYSKVLNQVFQTKVIDDDRCDLVSCDPADAPTAPSSDVTDAQAQALQSGPPEYWWQAYFKRSAAGMYRRTTHGQYNVVTKVPDNYWPGHGPTADDALNSAGPNAVYTPTIHAGLVDLVGDIADSDADVAALEADIEVLRAKIKLTDSTLHEIARQKKAAIDAILQQPDENFKFNTPTVDWLSYDNTLHVRLAA